MYEKSDFIGLTTQEVLDKLGLRCCESCDQWFEVSESDEYCQPCLDAQGDEDEWNAEYTRGLKR